MSRLKLPGGSALGCVSCGGAPLCPFQLSCGHVACSECKESISRCPKDDLVVIEELCFRDTWCEREVGNLTVHCPNEGCRWEEKVRLATGHLEVCGHEKTTCPNGSCSFEGKRKEVEAHEASCPMRPKHCDRCQGSYVGEVHECPKDLVPCTRCKETFRRESKGDHEASCSGVVRCCPFSFFSCGFEGTRDEVVNHLVSEMRGHGTSFSSWASRVDERVFGVQAPSVPGRGHFVWKVGDWSRLQNDARSGRCTRITSTPFLSKEFGHKLRLMLYPYGDGMGKGSHVSVFLAVMKGDHDEILSWPLRARVQITLKNLREGEDVTDAFVTDTNSASFAKPVKDVNVASGCPLFVPLSSLRNYVKNDAIYLVVEVSLR